MTRKDRSSLAAITEEMQRMVKECEKSGKYTIRLIDFEKLILNLKELLK